MSATSKFGSGGKSLLFSWGANSYGQLCNRNKNDVLIPGPVESSVHPASVKYISGGGGHTTVVTEDGNLYTAGWNDRGQLGIRSDMCHVTVLTYVPDILKVQSVACGWNHTLVISNTGQLYGFGSNQYGQLGIGENIKNVNHACPVSVSNKNIVSVAAGLRHSVLATDCGNVWTFGSNKCGQLGLEENGKKCVYLPEVVKTFRDTKVICVAAGSHHSLGISENGEVYCWGSNRHGQCGLDPCCQQEKVCWTPMKLAGCLQNAKALEVFSGWSHILVKTDCGKLFSWGRADYGQLGLGSDVVRKGFCFFPQEILRLRGAIQVCCGSEHNIAINRDGEAVCWGWNEHGICGTGNEINVHEPTSIQALVNMHVHLVGCGGGTTFAIASTKEQHERTRKE